RDELAHPGALQGVARVERARGIGVLQVLADHLRLAKLGAVDLEKGHLAHGRAREEVLALRGPAGRVELEADAFFQHGDARLVEVVADVEAAELEHRILRQSEVALYEPCRRTTPASSLRLAPTPP